MSKVRKRLLPYFMVSPYLTHLLVFTTFPVLFSLFLTFYKWNIIGPMEWTGLGNWHQLFNDRLFWKAILNTLKFLIIHIPLQLVFALLLAEVLNQKIILRGFFRAAFFLPVVISGVVITMMWQQLFNYETGLFTAGFYWLRESGMAH